MSPHYAPSSPPRILLVEDDRSLAEVLAEVLEDEGYLVERASNGEQALRRIRAGGPLDLVLSDVMMPRLSGTELVTALREQFDGSRPPVLLLSAGACPDISWHDVSFMPKPISIYQLLDVVKRLVHGSGQTRDLAESA